MNCFIFSLKYKCRYKCEFKYESRLEINTLLHPITLIRYYKYLYKNKALLYYFLGHFYVVKYNYRIECIFDDCNNKYKIIRSDYIPDKI